MTDKVEVVGAAVGQTLEALSHLFVPGTKLTFIARPPGGEDGDNDFIMTNDMLSEVKLLIERRIERGDESCKPSKS